MLQCHSSIFKDNDTYAIIWSIFLIFIFSGCHWCDKKLDTWFFHPHAGSNWRYIISRCVWYMFYVMSKRVSFFELHLHLILQCQIETLRQTCWVTDDRLLFKAFGILTLKSQLLQNHRLTADSKSVVSTEFFQTLSIYSTRFLCRNCPLWFLFPPINISLWILQAEQISRWWSPQFFHTSDEENHLTMGSEIS